VDSFVRTQLQDQTLLVQFGSPDEFPRLTRRVLGQLHKQFHEIRRSGSVRAAILAGSEKSFASGADLEEVSELTPAEALQFSALGQSVMREIEQCPKPVIAAIRGFCLGGGFDLAMACHARMAAEDAKFGHPGGSLGIITGWGGTGRLPRIVGRARAIELLASGRMITAHEAYQWRLVSQVVKAEQVVEAAREMARRLRR
jgi:enoyl-CoA hydratase